MELRILVPGREVLRTAVSRVSAEGALGSFTLLPQHVDLLTGLVPGIVEYRSSPAAEADEGGEGAEGYVAIDEGLLVKRGDAVVITVRRAVPSPDLDSLRRRLEEDVLRLDENERQLRRVLDRLEASFMKGIIELGGVGS
ncbi:MAG: F0F1 ATP synthase subunit epsilon [Prochlorococcaceae cyanobacterium]